MNAELFFGLEGDGKTRLFEGVHDRFAETTRNNSQKEGKAAMGKGKRKQKRKNKRAQTK
jgi:hypothetical protein